MARLAVSKARSSGTAFSAPPIALNKYDLSVLSDYGGRLVSVGQVARGMQGREAFQEIDYPQVFGGLGAEAPRRLPAALRPCYAATTGKAPLGRQKTLSSGISWVSA